MRPVLAEPAHARRDRRSVRRELAQGVLEVARLEGVLEARIASDAEAADLLDELGEPLRDEGDPGCRREQQVEVVALDLLHGGLHARGGGLEPFLRVLPPCTHRDRGAAKAVRGDGDALDAVERLDPCGTALGEVDGSLLAQEEDGAMRTIRRIAQAVEVHQPEAREEIRGQVQPAQLEVRRHELRHGEDVRATGIACREKRPHGPR